MFRRPLPWLLLIAILEVACTKPTSAPKLVVYAYDSFVGKDTVGALVADSFRAHHGVEVEYVVFPDAGQALNQVTLEGAKTRADIVVGIDGALASRAAESNAFVSLDPAVLKAVPRPLRFDSENRFVPFDYGFLAVLYDSRRTIPPMPGISLKDFAREPKYAKKVALQDPRTSSLGLQFFLWTRTLFPGAALDAFWKDMASRARTVSPGWSAAYGLFLKKEVDFVVSYTTSSAYHVEKDGTDAIRAVDLREGSVRQIEALGVVAASAKKDLALKWIEILLSPMVQTALPRLQWMYPVRADVSLPESFAKLSVPKKVAAVEVKETAAERAHALKRWATAMAGAK